MPRIAPREVLAALFEAAVDAARGERVLRSCSLVDDNGWVYDGHGGHLEVPLPAPGTGRIVVAGGGKAAASLARGLETTLGERISEGLIAVKHGHVEPLRRIQVLEADHPVPGDASLAATRAIVQLLDATTADDVVFFLLTGGASSLLCLPAAGLSFEDKIGVHQALIRSDAPIEEINTVRKHLSAVKGGKLRLHSRARTFCTLALSDVVGDDPATIGSGPTVPDSTTRRDALAILQRRGLMSKVPQRVLQYLRADESDTPAPNAGVGHVDFRIVASNHTSIEACAARARREGFDVVVLSERIVGHTHEAARQFAEAVRAASKARPAGSAPLVILAGGETTLRVTGTGRGGRNQEFATVAALHLQGLSNVTLLAAGTDGTDGPTDAAGAFADSTSIERARAAGVDVHACLANNDTYALLEKTVDLFKPGPTGTNVMDLVIALVQPTRLADGKAPGLI